MVSLKQAGIENRFNLFHENREAFFEYLTEDEDDPTDFFRLMVYRMRPSWMYLNMLSEQILDECSTPALDDDSDGVVSQSFYSMAHFAFKWMLEERRGQILLLFHHLEQSKKLVEGLKHRFGGRTIDDLVRKRRVSANFGTQEDRELMNWYLTQKSMISDLREVLRYELDFDRPERIPEQINVLHRMNRNWIQKYYGAHLTADMENTGDFMKVFGWLASLISPNKAVFQYWKSVYPLHVTRQVSHPSWSDFPFPKEPFESIWMSAEYIYDELEKGAFDKAKVKSSRRESAKMLDVMVRSNNGYLRGCINALSSFCWIIVPGTLRQRQDTRAKPFEYVPLPPEKLLDEIACTDDEPQTTSRHEDEEEEEEEEELDEDVLESEFKSLDIQRKDEASSSSVTRQNVCDMVKSNRKSSFVYQDMDLFLSQDAEPVRLGTRDMQTLCKAKSLMAGGKNLKWQNMFRLIENLGGSWRKNKGGSEFTMLISTKKCNMPVRVDMPHRRGHAATLGYLAYEFGKLITDTYGIDIERFKVEE